MTQAADPRRPAKPSPSVAKIAMINQHTHNYGDDCAAAAALLSIKARIDAQFHVYYHDRSNEGDLKMPDSGIEYIEHNGYVVRRRDTILLAFSLLGLPFAEHFLAKGTQAFINQMRSMNEVFVSPCGANIGHYRDWWFLGRVLAALRAGRTPIFHLNTIGKSGRWLFDFAARIALKRSKVFVRETRSFEYLKSVGVECVRGVDSAFALPALSPPAATKDEIALVITELSRWFPAHKSLDSNAMLDVIAPAVAQFASANRLEIRVIPHLHGLDEEQSFNNALKRKIEKINPTLHVNIDDEYPDYRFYERRLAEARFVLTMRYHGIVLSAKNGTPFVALSYEYKMNEAAIYSGMSEYVHDIADVTTDEILRSLEALTDNEDYIRKTLDSRATLLRPLAELPGSALWIEKYAGPKELS